eukprot:5452779-Amphidinium_carterae.1
MQGQTWYPNSTRVQTKTTSSSYTVLKPSENGITEQTGCCKTSFIPLIRACLCGQGWDGHYNAGTCSLKSRTPTRRA